MAASDESFGEKENLLKPEPATFEPGHYGNRGEIVDGWETRRRREPGNDWVLVRLGTPGTITSVDVDTSFFTGNYPESCLIEACGREGYPSPAELNHPETEWIDIVPRSALRGDAHNTFPVSDPRRFTHVRLSAYPDGGIARLRVLGHVVPDPRTFDGVTVDLASQEYGGSVAISSDGFYTSAHMLNRPDRARTMGEGWETRRRRDDGHDFVVFRLALPGRVRRLIVDTAHFKYNASAAVEAHGSATEPTPSPEASDWRPLLSRTRLQPDTLHTLDIPDVGPLTHMKIDAFPDGGMSRIRVVGRVDPGARRVAGYRWFNSLPVGQARFCLGAAGLSPTLVSEIVERRPISDTWLDALRAGGGDGRLLEETDEAVDNLAGLLNGRPDFTDPR
jgi:allantoicase